VRVQDIPLEEVRYIADFQREWHTLFNGLTDGEFYVDATVSIQGDAPKSFIRIREHTDGRRSGKRSRRRRLTWRKSRWPAYIAKVGSKWYPVESITEHLITRIGQVYGLRIADSQIRMIGKQVRFLSRYFLRKRDQSLYHGIEMFKSHLDSDLVEEIARTRREQEFYTFQTVCRAVNDTFPSHVDNIMRGMVEMLTFDALVGNNDRHALNWGVVTAAKNDEPPRFSPVFDTARALFWNASEPRIRQLLSDKAMMDGYVRRSAPQIGWDNQDSIGHFDLIKNIYREYALFRSAIMKYSHVERVSAVEELLEREFSQIMSIDRRSLILKCLVVRQGLLREAASE
jgi:HipA-like C-terminal domain